MCYLIQAYMQNWAPKNITFILPRKGYEMLGNNNLSICELINLALKLPLDNNNYLSPRFASEKKNVENFIERHNIIKGKALILAPFAVSVTQISDNVFWEIIAKRYKSKGYTVITNLQNSNELPIQGTEGAFLSLDEIFILAEYCGHFIGLRSGLCDLLAFSTCEMIVVYPQNKGNVWKEKYTFSNMFFEKDIVEIMEADLVQCI